MEFLQAIKDFFTILFLGNSPEGKRRKGLRRIQQSLKLITPPIYRTGVVLPAFPSAILTFWQFIKPLQEVYVATLGSSETRIVLRSRDAFFDRALTQEQRTQRNAFSYDFRKKDIDEATNAKNVMETNERTFMQFLKSYDSLKMHDMEALLCKLTALGDVLTFDYENFIKTFDSGFSSSLENYVPTFSPVSLKQILPLLSDFYFVYHGVTFDMNLATALMLLFEVSSGERISEELRIRIAKIIKNLSSFSGDTFSPNLFCSLIQLGKEDPSFIPSVSSERPAFLSDYKQRALLAYQADTEKLNQEMPQDNLMHLIKHTFGETQLESLFGYTEDLSLQIHQLTPAYFMWVKPLRVIKTFMKVFFTENLVAVFKNILTEGFFSNKQFESDLSTSFYSCENIEEHFKKFEEDFEVGKPFDCVLLASYVTEIQGGKNFEQKIQSMADNINYHAKQLVQSETSLLEELTIKMEQIISESKRTVPENIINIRTLVNNKPFDYIGLLEKQLELANGFFDIMKSFAVLKQTRENRE